MNARFLLMLASIARVAWRRLLAGVAVSGESESGGSVRSFDSGFIARVQWDL